MKITNIKLKNFRNYPDLDLAINGNTVVLSGPNAVGKTNLLESVYFASLFKSFRDDNEFIFLKDTQASEIEFVIEKGSETHNLKIFLEKRDKIYANFLLNGVKKRRTEAQGFLKVVIFEPTDVDMFTKQPEGRRKYLNMVLSQKAPRHMEELGEYKKAIFYKNKLLQNLKSGLSTNSEELSSWNSQLVKIGSGIIMERRKFCEYLNDRISEVYSAISGFHRPVEVVYSSLPGDTLEEIESAYREKLEKYAPREKAAAVSLVGPHKDDFSLQSDGLYLSPFSSRGELRSQVLALKILELEYLSQGEEKPVLLLDDVLSELDETRRTFLLKFLQNKFQTFITTTHPLEMPAQHVTLTPALEAE
ncbi:MAG: DNA replication/repair protein RecF [Candidatus Doudnabacteria bacterium]|nr:DNA replication/repair protein RecF [Candidatus Doudnabacteria bacterium]